MTVSKRAQTLVVFLIVIAMTSLACNFLTSAISSSEEPTPTLRPVSAEEATQKPQEPTPTQEPTSK